jgi:hypothetical protein
MTVEGWTIIFWRDGVPYSIVMVKGTAIPRFCRDGDGLAWTNWGPEQDGWLVEEKGFSNWAMEERRWVVNCDFKGRYDGYIFLPHMVSLLGTWPNDQLWDMHLFWRGDWFWVQYEQRKSELEA